MQLLNILSLFLVLPLLALAAEDYYKLLNIDRDASDRDIKRSYRRLSKKYHPDKNPGDETVAKKFVEIADAYEALSDPELRRIYNQYGHEGVEQHKKQASGGGRQHADPFNLFSRFFGGGGHFGGGERRGPNMEAQVAVPLRDFYNGAEHEIKVEKQAICSACEGSGSEDGKRETCGRCRGQGMIIQKAQLAPGIFQQMQMQCDQCGGQGTQIKHRCKVCNGGRVVREEETHRLVVEKGLPKGGKVVFENEADESPDWVAGDLLVAVVEMDPKVGSGEEKHDQADGNFFRRKGDHLYWREVLSLREAWMGDWTRNLTHMDGHVVRLHRKRGEVVQPGTVQTIEGEGMPIHQHESGPEYGNLLVEYTVVLPDQMEKGMEKDFWTMWEKWRKKNGIDLQKDSGRPVSQEHDEL
ncbi:DnaJ-related protein spj1 [Elsinoe australis]|uniref:DnaJ-related protein spj1 n=1 Tax=Elsinoe australis TaxID=40998 RepID=A0A2P7ZDP3_9PEZI|nr:DnaJ-related protein spj1 [Elsinoe australis]